MGQGAATRYEFEGTVIPDCDFNWPTHSASIISPVGTPLALTVSVDHSLIRAIAIDQDDIALADVRNATAWYVGNIINASALLQSLALTAQLQSVRIEGGDIEPLTADVFTFVGGPFSRQRVGYPEHGAQVSVPTDLLHDRHFSRATLELRNAAIYHDYTAMHCRFAVESIRNAFEGATRVERWAALRENLRFNEATLRRHEAIANRQRHGENAPQSWAERQSAMQIAWAVVWRYFLFLESGSHPLDVELL